MSKITIEFGKDHTAISTHPVIFVYILCKRSNIIRTHCRIINFEKYSNIDCWHYPCWWQIFEFALPETVFGRSINFDRMCRGCFFQVNVQTPAGYVLWWLCVYSYTCVHVRRFKLRSSLTHIEHVPLDAHLTTSI